MPFQRRVLILEDDEFTGSLIAGALANEGFDTEYALSAADAKRKLGTFDPDAVLVDIDLGAGPNGLDFVQMVRKNHPDVAAILLSKHGDVATAGIPESRIPDGVAYLRKSLIHSTQKLAAAIDEALSGHANSLRHDRHSSGMLGSLTKTQRETLRLMALGHTNGEIARLRGTSVSSVEQVVAAIYRAFELAHDDATTVARVEAIRRYVAESGLPPRT